MKIHEYQAKQLLREFDIPVPDGEVSFRSDQACRIARTLGRFPVAVKAQIHAGGRGKGGGVKLARSIAEVRVIAELMQGMTLVTDQTGPGGRVVKKVLIEAGQTIAKEMYISLLLDRKTASILIMASRDGGVDIEETAEKTPEGIIKVLVGPQAGIQPYHLRKLSYGLGIPGAASASFFKLIKNLYKLFVAKDCALIEINPLILTTDNRVMALDAKIDFDANALFRHKDIMALRDTDEEEALEVEASKHNLNYINLNAVDPTGNVGNIVNGAGLAMATMDIIKQAGASPANFMDVGGGASAEQVENAFRIILADEKVKVVLINIFGGILRCDVFAAGVVDAARKTGITLPVVVRMEGTNEEEGKQILARAGLNIISAADLNDAAKKIARAVGKTEAAA
ncbi:MAG: ADP-forming succinate--CoA ligase subunit beta [Desulfobacterales bacterium]|nr:ADP-forming succinate--CoA ligase subunit beta [Desulfobacterales bacterium]